jgi:hypothetical protein
LFRKRIAFVSQEIGVGQLPFDGLVHSDDPNTIIIDAETRQGMSFLLGHELGHSMQHQQPALYDALKKTLLGMAENWDGYRQMLKESGYETESKQDVEFVNDFIGSQFTNQDFWNELKKRDEKVFTKLVAYALKYLKDIGDKIGILSRDVRPYFRDIEAARAELVKALEAYQRGEMPEKSVRKDALKDSPDGEMSVKSALPDLFTASRAPDAGKKLGGVTVGRMNALAAYRSLTGKREKGIKLTAMEEQQLLDAEVALGQKLAFDMEALKQRPGFDRQGRKTQFRPQVATDTDSLFGADNSFKIDREGQMSLFSSPASFYSPLERAVEAKIPARATPEQIMATVKAADVKAEEIKWSGIEQALGNLAVDGKVSKDTLLAYLRDEGSVRFEEVAYGYEWQAYNDERNRLGKMLGSREITAQEYSAKIRELDEQTDDSKPVRFTKYTLPGGENYREIVLAMPAAVEVATKKTGYKIVSNDGRFSSAPSSSEGDARARLIQIASTMRRPISDFTIEPMSYEKKEKDLSKDYTSSHFPDVPNYVAHMRLNERDGGLFIEEIQSDRHQAGRKKGYKGEVDVVAAIDKLTREQATRIIKLNERGNDTLEGDETVEELRDTVRYYLDEEGQDETGETFRFLKNLAGTDGVPDAPFRTTWPLALFKRALRDAVAGGKTWIGWTDGETQNDRFDLSKQIDQLNYSGDAETGWGLQLVKDGEVISETDVSDDKLDDNVGKDVAARIRSGVGNIGMGTVGTLEGLDLKVGGSGMKGFYDNILPKEIGKYVEKLGGGKVEKSTIETGEAKIPSWDRWHLNTYGQEVDASLSDEIINTRHKEWERLRDTPQSTPIWRIDITPAMREGVTGGQSLFSSPAPGFRNATTLTEARSMAEGFVGLPIANKDDGLTATVSRNALGKMLSQSAVRKSDTESAHAFAVANLDRLFEEAIRTHSGPDEKGSIHIAAMHRYHTPFPYRGEIIMAKMTVKEFARQADGNRLYTVEALDMVKPAGNWVPSISEDRRNYTPQAGFEGMLPA